MVLQRYKRGKNLCKRIKISENKYRRLALCIMTSNKIYVMEYQLNEGHAVICVAEKSINATGKDVHDNKNVAFNTISLFKYLCFKF